MVKPIKKEPEQNDPDDVIVTVQPNDRKAPLQIDPDQNMMRYTCTCKRRLVVDLKTATVKELHEKNANIESVEMADGQTEYIIPQRDSEFLGLASRPKIYKYYFGKAKRAVLITSKRTINDKARMDIRKLLDNQD